MSMISKEPLRYEPQGDSERPSISRQGRMRFKLRKGFLTNSVVLDVRRVKKTIEEINST